MIKTHVKIARPDHWPKNVMVLPGAFLAFVVEDSWSAPQIIALIMAIIGACFIASANYTINEYLDRSFDRHHPQKKHRALVDADISGKSILVQYITLSGVGLAFLLPLNSAAVLAGAGLLIMGIIYNVSPFRTKDIAFLDVISESINNPIRLILGWAAVTTIILPPASLILCFWFGGAFLMAAKRYSEYRFINSSEQAGLYRKSFQNYSETSLLMSSYFYSLLSVFMLAVFLIKYRAEFLLSFPLITSVFTWYLALSHKYEEIGVREPEKIFTNVPFLVVFSGTAFFVLILFFVDIPFVDFLVSHSVLQDYRLP